MSNSSFMGGTEAPGYAPGRDVDALGPSDSTDSGSDIQGETQMATLPDNPAEWGALTTGGDNDSDAMGTGERASASGEAARDGADILPDRVFDPDLEGIDGADGLGSEDVAALPDDSVGGGDGEGDELDDDEAAEGDDVASGRTGRSSSAGPAR